MSPELEQREATAVLVPDCTVQYSITGSPGGEQREEGGETSNQAGSQSPSYYGHHHMSMSSSDYIIRLLILWLARGKEGREIIILCRQ